MWWLVSFFSEKISKAVKKKIQAKKKRCMEEKQKKKIEK